MLLLKVKAPKVARNQNQYIHLQNFPRVILPQLSLTRILARALTSTFFFFYLQVTTDARVVPRTLSLSSFRKEKHQKLPPASSPISGHLRSDQFNPIFIWKSTRLGTMSEVFEGYERQYCELSANLSRKCTATGALNGEQKKQKVSEIKAGIDEAEALIRKMDLEARSLQPNVKAVLLAKLREYKSDLNNLKTEVKRIVSGNLNAAARDELLESGMADTLTASADQRTRLVTTTERLGKSGDRIKESRRTMLETEELGVSILQDLHSQRQSLLHANNTLHGVDDNVGRSKKILTNMSRRMSRNKWMIGSIIAVLVIAIALILYFKLK